MHRKKLFFGSLALGAGLAATGLWLARSSSAKPAARGTSFEAIDAYIEQQMHRLNIPGASLAIVEGDQIVHMRGFGRARPGGEAPTPQTPFFIGSLTKSFTALAVMQLVEGGKVELDAPVQRYLPWFQVASPQVSSQVTVRHLLNQTGGLPMWTGLINLDNFDNRRNAAECQMRALSTVRITQPVGSRFEYSNLNYNLLGLIIEAVSGETYSGYIQHHIFDPLEMRHSYTSKAAALQNGLAMGYRYWFGVPVAEPNLPVPRGSLPSGQLISCAEDMAHYLIAHLNKGCFAEAKILSGSGTEELYRPAAEIKEMGFSFGSYGMGWVYQETEGTIILSHSGAVPDFAAFMALLPEQNTGMILLINVNHAVMKMTLDDVGMVAAKQLAGLRPAPPFFGGALWIMRGLLLIPALQIISAIVSLWRLRDRRQNPAASSSRGFSRWQHTLLPLIPNLLAMAAPIFLRSHGMHHFIRLFMPDVYWITLISSFVAGMWASLRTGLALRILRQ